MNRSFPLRTLAALAAVPLLALTAAACGGAGTGTKDAGIATVDEAPTPSAPSSASATPAAAGRSAFYDAQLALALCMRKNGLKDWPDPKLSGYLDMQKLVKLQRDEEKRDSQKTYTTAAGKCRNEYQKVGLAEPPKDQQKIYESLLAHAKCMRENGVSKFRNPTMAEGNAQPGGESNPMSPQLDPESPAYRTAEEKCRPHLIEPAQGMQ